MSVYLSNRRILATVGACGRNKLNVSRLCAAELGEGCMINGVITAPEQFEQELADFWNKFRLPKKEVRLVIESGQFMIRRLTVPIVTPRKLDKLIKSEFGDTGAIENPIYDYMTVGSLDQKGSGMAEVLAVVADKGFIEAHTSIMSGLGIKISSIAPAQCAILRLMVFCKKFADRTCILASADGANLTCMLVENEEYVYSSKARLFQEPGTQAYTMEIVRTLSGIKQFHATRRRERGISDVYFGGITSNVLESLQTAAQMLDMNIRFFPDGERISLPSNVEVIGELENTEASVRNFIPVLGKLVKN